MASGYRKQLNNLKKDKLINFYINKNMKLKQLVEGIDSLGILMELKLPSTISYRIALLAKKINPELEAYNKQRNELLKEYASPVKDEDGKDTGQLKFKDEQAIKDFNGKIEPLLEEEINVDIPEINIADFAGINIEPKHLVNLDWLIKQ